MDRFIQQTIVQVLAPIWESHFHPHSCGFKPNRNAHQAVYQARSEIAQGKKWAVDLDLDAFFDRVNHDRLMNTLKRRIKDKDLLRLINRYLKSGIQRNEHKRENNTRGAAR